MSKSLDTRHRQIITAARRTGRVTVDELVARIGVTSQTIRKDLNDLCARGVLTRVHGGAVLSSGVENLGHYARSQLAMEQKREIGRAAAERIPDGASLFISIGTTTEEVARCLAKRSGLLVITNNLNVVDILCQNPEIEIIVVGGRVRHSDRAAVGPSAVEFIGNFKVDFAVVGTSAIDQDGSLLDFDLSEVQVSRAIFGNARSVVLVADQSKLERNAPVRVGHLSEIDLFVTDHIESADLLEICELNDVEVVMVMPERRERGVS